MIYTQTYAELGCPKHLKAVGMITVEVDPTNASGYGLTYERTFEILKEEFDKRYQGMFLLRARVKILPGNAHPTYNRICMRLTGDLYELWEGPNDPRTP